ncbi:MAG: AraC family transcriptional regulator [Cellulophaga sp.]|nr:AraC family transcriptional regulator [Cellulophaga sp.]
MDDITIKEGFLGQKMIALPNSILDIVKCNEITQKFYITDLGYYPKANHHYRKRKNGSNQFIFIYCVNGKGEIILEGSSTLISPNQFFIIPKKTNHEYRANEADPWSIYWFHFDGAIAFELYKRYLGTNIKNYKTISFSVDKIQIFEKVFSLFNRNSLEYQMEYANLLSLNLISSFIYHDFEADIQTNSRNTLVESIKNFLLRNLDKNFTLEQIASKFNYSKSYLHTKFKVDTGYPILVFFNLKKTQKACEYLNYTDLSIKEISFKVGFEDPLYFSRIFKNFMGKSPRNYRKNHRK